MNVAESFIKRPVMTTLVMLGILMFGIMGYRLLPVYPARALAPVAHPQWRSHSKNNSRPSPDWTR